MDIDRERIDQLVTHPSEALNVEIKAWIDPNTPAGAAKIAKAALALRNRDGGFLLIGFHDKTLQPLANNRTSSLLADFHLDKIQGLISNVASERFEIAVVFGNRDGSQYPVICIPPGVRVPVAAKNDLLDGAKKLIAQGDVYFRTLNANGTPSSAKIRPQDWRDLVEICFENREADVGRFLRRHLTGESVVGLTDFLRTLLSESYANCPPVQPTAQQGAAPRANLGDRLDQVMQEGKTQYDIARAGRLPNPHLEASANYGAWNVALILSPERQDTIPDQVFLNTIASANPNLTGWPIWLDSRGFSDESARPRVTKGAWEALIVSLSSGWSRHLDFMRLHPKGEFYLRRVLQDDLTNKIPPLTALDPVLMTFRVTEAIAVALAFGTALGLHPETARVGMKFTWERLSGRALNSWANPEWLFSSGGKAQDSDIATIIEFSVDTPASAIAPLVDLATRDLFALFDGFRMPIQSIETIVKQLLDRRL